MKKFNVLLIVTILFVFSSCSQRSESNNAPSYDLYDSESGYAMYAPSATMAPQMAKEEFAQDSQSKSFETNKKIVKTGHMSITTAEFDHSASSIENITNSYGGYVESSSFNNNSVNGREYRNGSYTLRVPSEFYDDVKKEIQSLGKINNFSDNIDDFTSQYLDIESRLYTKKAEETRLLELLEQAESIEDIITVEERLSYVRTDIEIYEMHLKNIDDNVSFSTLSINITEDANAVITTVDAGLLERIGAGFKSSVNNTIMLFENIVVGAAQLSVPLVFVLILVVVGVNVYRLRKKKNTSEDI